MPTDRFSSKKGAAGFNVVELMIVLAIVGILFAISLPMFRAWLQNAQIRRDADSIYSGLQRARTEAVKNNQCAAFILTSGTNFSDWQVVIDTNRACNTFGPPYPVPPAGNRQLVANEASRPSSPARIGVSLNLAQDTAVGLQNPFLAQGDNMPNALFVFDGMGRLDLTNAGNGARYIDVFDPDAAGDPRIRRLRVLVNQGGQLKLCDPRFSLEPNDPTYNVTGCER